MKNYLILLATIIFVTQACKPSRKDYTFNYAIAGPKSLHITNNDSASLPLHATYISGYPLDQTISLRISGLPNGITSNPDSVSIKPGKDASLMISAKNMIAGTYHVKIISSSANVGSRSYDLDLVIDTLVMPPVYQDCSEKLADHFVLYEGYIPWNAPHFDVVAVAGYPHRVAIQSLFKAGNGTVYADLGCDDSTFVIPVQHFGDTTVWGAGKFIIPYKTIYFFQTTVIAGDTQTLPTQYQLH